MENSTAANLHRFQIKKAFERLEGKFGYKQNQVVMKLETLGCPLSNAMFNAILNDKRASLGTLVRAARAMEKLLLEELDEHWDSASQQFIPHKTAGWQPRTVADGREPVHEKTTVGMVVHPNGRLKIEQKTDFISDAQSEVLELGLRLKTFADYFFSRNENEYKVHIVKLLQRCVRVRVCLLHPKSQEAQMYFSDRARAKVEEATALDDADKTLERLRRICAEFRAKQYPGFFEIYLYKHLPVAHFLTVDAASDAGKMLFSPYLYGLPRAECPIYEIYKRQQKTLFRKHLQSLDAILKDAQLVETTAVV